MKIQTLTELSRQKTAELLSAREGEDQLVTLLMPMERKGAETRKNSIVFKNAHSSAKEQLSHDQIHHERIGKTLDELESLAEPTNEFWQNQLEGLAMVISSSGNVEAYKVPIKLDEFTWVGSQPYLSPLAELLSGKRYYILVLSQGDLRLYQASRWFVIRKDLGDIPTSLEEAMKYDDPEKSLQWRSVSAQNAPGAGGGDSAYHGHGTTGDEAHNKKLRRFYEMVAGKLADHLFDTHAPLVLMGGDSEIGHFRQVNQYHNTSDEVIAFSPANLSDNELEEKIRDWVAERDAEAEEEALEDLHNQLGAGKGTADFDRTIKAAADGLVDKLFVISGETRYGVNDRDKDQVTVHDEPQAGDDELIGHAATDAVNTGADVHFVDPDKGLPDDAVVAAVLRY